MSKEIDYFSLEVNFIDVVLTRLGHYVNIYTLRDFIEIIVIVLKNRGIKYEENISSIMRAVIDNIAPEEVFFELKNSYKVLIYLYQNKISKENIQLLRQIAGDDTMQRFEDHIITKTTFPDEETYDKIVEEILAGNKFLG